MTPGGAAPGRTGTRYENELIGYFRDAGWGAMRCPASGSATADDLPDVLAGRNLETDYGQAWAIEAKAGKKTTLYVDADEVAALEAFADVWGATPLLAARPTTQATGREHYCIKPADARMTDSGRYGLPREELADRAFAVVGPEEVRVV